MPENFFEFNHGCSKSQFFAEDLVKVNNEITDTFSLQCHCSECQRVHILDLSQEFDSKLRRTLRRMMVRQQIITIPDELYDYNRKDQTEMTDFAIQFNIGLLVFPDTIVGHRDLQDDWEDVVSSRKKLS